MSPAEIIEELEDLAAEWKRAIHELKASGLPEHAGWTQTNLDELQAIIRRAKAKS